MKDLTLNQLNSPIGTILLITDQINGQDILCGLEFAGYETRTLAFLGKRFGEFRLNESQTKTGISERILAYLDGDYSIVDQIPVSTGGTAFQQQVWLALREIPVGTTLTYGQLALRLGKPSASRAVGLTNSLNPISIVLPCHRVIGANGNLTGYAGGLERKRWLLEHEGALPVRSVVPIGEAMTEPGAAQLLLPLS
ncbi:MAG: methylated-DNA--[protein]-cysteine S-methyltransferase [Elainella sp.]